MNRYGGDTSSLEMGEIKTSNENDVNTVHGHLQILQQRTLVVETESHAGESFMPPYYIVGGLNENASIRSRKKIW